MTPTRPTRSHRGRMLGIAALLALLLDPPTPSARAADPIPTVEPSELANRADLVGKEFLVDDRIRYFLENRRSQGYDQFLLRRTDVPFYLPPNLRTARPPSEPGAVVRAILRSQGGRLVGEVVTLDLQPADDARLARELGRLRPDDLAGRRRWALWAERRGHELPDPKLEARGVELEAEVLWAEAGQPGADPVALADGAADRPIERATRDALYQRGFRAALARANSIEGLGELASRIRTAIPRAGEPRPEAATAADPAPGADPGDTYRAADPDERARLDRRLYAAAVEKWLLARVAETPGEANAVADEAGRTLPDRPDVAEKLRLRGLAAAERGVAGMRQAEVEDLARSFRERGQEDRARKVLADWLLDRRRNRLRDGDAEGRILLAAGYEKLLGDRVTAAALLAEADALDPGAQAITDAFLRLGYRKGAAGWYDPAALADSKTKADADPAAGDRPRAEAAPRPRDEGRDSLRGLTRAEARARMGGKPDHVARSVTQGMIVEQWVYRTGRSTQHLLFRIDAATTEPRVVAAYTISR